jgi:inositol-phosphate phosphatase/L-galactose 1-phosphate phosphatase
VTATDRTCEDIIIARLQAAFPTHLVIGEEGSSAQGSTNPLTSAPTWLIDPLDGTTNFVHGFPFVCVSVALAVNHQVVVGVVHNPILHETFTALRGAGAFRNDKGIRVSDVQVLAKALAGTEVGVSRDPIVMNAITDRIHKVAARTRSIRASGSCAMALCGVAMGRLDAFYEIGFGGPWDVAAGSLIVEEAGGSVLDPSGKEFRLMGRRVLATNAHLGVEMAEILDGALKAEGEPQ